MKSFKLLTILLISILIFANCSSNEVVINDEEIPETTDAVPFITPPFDDVNVEYVNYSFKAENGDTIFHESGSILLFPANSMLDGDGNLVSGKVDIAYREFSDPVDFFLSGIPMNYDSAGVDYMFESSAMCEINASQEGKELFVNPENKPEVNLTSRNASNEQNLYYLDEETKCWVNKGKDEITQVIQNSEEGNTNNHKTNEGDLPQAPVKPRKPNGKSPQFVLEVDPESVPELKTYNELVFEIHEDDNSYKASDGNELWEDVKMKPGKKAGTYFVTFINATRSVTYLTRPVFEGKNYDQAISEFNDKQDQYETLKKNRLEKEDKFAQEVAAINAQNKKFDSINKIRNERLRLLQERRKLEFDSLKSIMLANARIREQKLREREALNTYSRKIGAEAIRTFQLEKFGIWNCDQPIFNGNSIQVIAKFKDESGKELQLPYKTLVYSSVNGIRMFNSDQIETIARTENMIWGVLAKEQKFVYVSASEFDKAKITYQTGEHTFAAKVHPKKITSPEDIREVLSMRASF